MSVLSDLLLVTLDCVKTGTEKAILMIVNGSPFRCVAWNLIKMPVLRYLWIYCQICWFTTENVSRKINTFTAKNDILLF
jgi:hypothetical protein